jgi:DHA2 family multidrug resistance protein-like MFS transporter
VTLSGADGAAQVRAGRAEWAGLAVRALPTLLVTMDGSVLFLAVPKLTRHLQPSAAQLLWISDVYGFLIAGALVTMGALGGARALLGVAGGALAPSSLALLGLRMLRRRV